MDNRKSIDDFSLDLRSYVSEGDAFITKRESV